MSYASSEWGHEIMNLIVNLQERLDIIKQYGCLTVSLDVCHLKPRRSVQLIRCTLVGTKMLADAVHQRFRTNSGKPLSSFQTPELLAMTESCCLDDENVDFVFKQLRITEMLEHSTATLSSRDHAQILCGIIGELEVVATELTTTRWRKDKGESEEKCANYLRATEKQIIDFICEKGRDRASYINDICTGPSLSRPRPRTFDASSVPVFHSDSSLSKEMLESQLRVYSLQTDSDPMLQKLLLQGSLLSIWYRLHSLWQTIDPTRGNRNCDTENVALSSTIAAKIRWSVFWAVQQMSRLRRLMFTRLLQTLCSPIFIAPPSHLDIGSSTYISKQLVQLVVAGFLDSHTTRWPYESIEQLQAINKCPLLSEDMRKQLSSIICIADSMSFCMREEESEQDIVHIDQFKSDAVIPIFKHDRYFNLLQLQIGKQTNVRTEEAERQERRKRQTESLV